VRLQGDLQKGGGLCLDLGYGVCDVVAKKIKVEAKKVDE
jgi:hypothetical protein